MRYTGAITIDTSIFEAHGLRLETGLLNRLQQFREGPVRILISEIVARELNDHLARKTAEVISQLKKTIKDVNDHIVFNNINNDIKKLDVDVKESANIAAQRLEAYFKSLGAEIIEVEGNLDIKQLLVHYFDAKPPFEENAKKKSEFPDALALMSIEKWARDNDTEVVAVSADKGWLEYGKQCDKIEVIADLAEAIERFQPHNEAFAFCNMLAQDIPQGKAGHLISLLADSFRSFVEDMQVYAEACSSFEYEDDVVECTYDDFEFILDRKGKAIIKLVQVDEDSITVATKVNIKGEATCSFDFSVYDSYDKDSVGIGSCNSSTEFDFDTGVLFSIEGDFRDGVDSIDIADVEVLYAPDSIDFGEVEPDWGDPDDYYPDDENSEETPQDLEF